MLSSRGGEAAAAERAIPGAPRRTWYCSVSFRWKRRPGGGVARAGGGRAPAPGAALRRSGLEQRDEPIVRDVAGCGDDVAPVYIERW